MVGPPPTLGQRGQCLDPGSPERLAFGLAEAPGEAAGPGENGPVLSRLFSRLCTEGDFVPTVGGVKKEGGRWRCFIGIETNLCLVAFSP